MPKKRANGEGSIRKRKDGRWEGRYTAGCDPATGGVRKRSLPRLHVSSAWHQLLFLVANIHTTSRP